MNYTTPEQSRKLLELGLPQETADLVYFKYTDSDDHTPRFEGAAPMILMDIPISEVDCETLACWSTDRLLDLMPTIKENSDEYVLYLMKEPTKTLKGKDITSWYCSYALLDNSNEELIVFSNESKIETTYNMMVWLLTNGYIKR